MHAAIYLGTRRERAAHNPPTILPGINLYAYRQRVDRVDRDGRASRLDCVDRLVALSKSDVLKMYRTMGANVCDLILHEMSGRRAHGGSNVLVIEQQRLQESGSTANSTLAKVSHQHLAPGEREGEGERGRERERKASLTSLARGPRRSRASGILFATLGSPLTQVPSRSSPSAADRLWPAMHSWPRTRTASANTRRRIARISLHGYFIRGL